MDKKREAIGCTNLCCLLQGGTHTFQMDILEEAMLSHREGVQLWECGLKVIDSVDLMDEEEYAHPVSPLTQRRLYLGIGMGGGWSAGSRGNEWGIKIISWVGENGS